MPAIIGGLISGGASILGGVLGGNAQSAAAKSAANSAREGLNWTKGVYNTAATNLQPNISTGQNALYSLSSLYGLGGGPNGEGAGAGQAFQDFTQTPAYQFPFQQGQLGANRALAAQGLTGSGAQAKGLTQYGQGFASTQFDNYLQRLQALAESGRGAATSLGGVGSGVSQSVNSGSQFIGNTMGGGILGSSNSMMGGIGGALGALGSNDQSKSSFGATSPFGQGVGYLKGLWSPQTGGGGAP